MKITFYHFNEDNGDGSTTTRFFTDPEKAKSELEKCDYVHFNGDDELLSSTCARIDTEGNILAFFPKSEEHKEKKTNNVKSKRKSVAR